MLLPRPSQPWRQRGGYGLEPRSGPRPVTPLNPDKTKRLPRAPLDTGQPSNRGPLKIEALFESSSRQAALLIPKSLNPPVIRGETSPIAISPSAVAPSAAVVEGTRTGTDASADQRAPTSAYQASNGCSAQRSSAHATRGTATPSMMTMMMMTGSGNARTITRGGLSCGGRPQQQSGGQDCSQ